MPGSVALLYCLLTHPFRTSAWEERPLREAPVAEGDGACVAVTINLYPGHDNVLFMCRPKY